jgi:hypothetical protein
MRRSAGSHVVGGVAVEFRQPHVNHLFKRAGAGGESAVSLTQRGQARGDLYGRAGRRGCIGFSGSHRAFQSKGRATRRGRRTKPSCRSNLATDGPSLSERRAVT